MPECEKFCRPLEIDCNMLHINSNMKHTQKNTSRTKKNLGRPQKLRGGSILQIHVCNLKDETCLANAWQVQDLSEGKVTWGTALRQFQLLDPHEPRTLRCPTKLPCLHMHTVVRMAWWPWWSHNLCLVLQGAPKQEKCNCRCRVTARNEAQWSPLCPILMRAQWKNTLCALGTRQGTSGSQV